MENIYNIPTRTLQPVTEQIADPIHTLNANPISEEPNNVIPITEEPKKKKPRAQHNKTSASNFCKPRKVQLQGLENCYQAAQLKKTFEVPGHLAFKVNSNMKNPFYIAINPQLWKSVEKNAQTAILSILRGSIGYGDNGDFAEVHNLKNKDYRCYKLRLKGNNAGDIRLIGIAFPQENYSTLIEFLESSNHRDLKVNAEALIDRITETKTSINKHYHAKYTISLKL